MNNLRTDATFISAGWHGTGWLPAPGVIKSPEDFEHLTDTMVQISQPERDKLLTVGWFPDHDPNGHYKGALLRRRRDGDPPEADGHSYQWCHTPVNSCEASDVREITQWFNQHTAGDIGVHVPLGHTFGGALSHKTGVKLLSLELYTPKNMNFYVHTPKDETFNVVIDIDPDMRYNQTDGKYYCHDERPHWRRPGDTFEVREKVHYETLIEAVGWLSRRIAGNKS